jgi:tetratricopeptide (TPR) repeat protein
MTLQSATNFRTANHRHIAGIMLLLTAFTFLVFARSISGAFVTWDDEPLIYANPNIALPTADSLRWHWTHPHMKLYMPVIYSAWWSIARLEQARSGQAGELSPVGFHLANVAVHAASVCIVFLLLQRTIGSNWSAAAGAALFAADPLQVEAVSWATGMKDLLGGFLTLSAVTAYLGAAREAQRQHFNAARARWIFATLLFLLALLAKPSAVVTPLLAGVLDYLLIRRNLRSALRWLWPWAILSAAWMVVTIRVQPSTNVYGGPLWARPLIACDALAFYLGKVFWPLNLAMDYGRMPARILGHASVYWRWTIPAAAGVLLWLTRRRELWAAGLFFVLALLPVLGFVRFEFQSISTVADRYAYVAMVGPSMALAYVAARGRLQKKFLAGACGALLSACAVLSWMQTGVWRDSASVYQNAIAVNPQSLTATHDLAVVYDKSGRSPEAVQLYLRVLHISPTFLEGWDDLASALKRAQQRRPDLGAKWAALHARVASFYASQGRTAEAREQSELAHGVHGTDGP